MRSFTPSHRSLVILVALFLGVFIPNNSYGEEVTVCGNIIAPAGWTEWLDPFSPITNTPITDCTDPFEKTIGIDSPYSLTIEGVVVTEGGEVVVGEAGTQNYKITGSPSQFTGVNHILFYHEGNDFQYFSTNELEPTEVDFRRLANEFFDPDVDIEPYISALLSDDPWDYFSEESQQDLLDDFDDYIYDNPTFPALLPGTYTLVSKEYPIWATQNNWYQKLFAWLIPTAYAQFDESNTFTLTFTLVEATSEPAGPSNILFLPGIMGSRLYEEGQQCDDFGDEQERWPSRNDCEQLRLQTTTTGTSVNDIYTKVGESSIIDEIYTSNLYKTFLGELRDWKKDKLINDYKAVPYDWRLRLDDILKSKLDSDTGRVIYDVTIELSESYIYQILEELANSSLNGKVTIVAHSNGGLVVKALLSALQAYNDPLLDKIDNVILVASPQVGTPDAVVGMLHGSEIGGGFVASQEVTRQLLNTAPFGHHLLPNQNYFSEEGVDIQTPIITFQSGLMTDDWRDQFGGTITTSKQLHAFLSTDSGRTKPDRDDLSQPEVVDNFLLNYANTMAEVTENWIPGPSTKVYQIAGTGIETPSGITYYTDKECVRGGYLWFECTEYKPKLGYRLNFTFDGDETVVVPSALAMEESESVDRLWLDLERYGREVSTRVHKNILEVPDVIDFIKNTIHATTASYRYLSSEAVVPDIGQRLSFTLHSPLDMYLKSSQGITSSSTSEIPGAVYRRYGEIQYISVPAGISNLVLYLKGYKDGSFTLVEEEWQGGNRVRSQDYQAVPTGSSALVTLPLDSLDTSAELQIDIDGDGVVDGVVSALDDEVVVAEIPEVTNVESKTPSAGARIIDRLPKGEVAGISTDSSQEWYYSEIVRLLEELVQLLVLLEQSRYEK